jgi:hypothetical protein
MANGGSTSVTDLFPGLAYLAASCGLRLRHRVTTNATPNSSDVMPTIHSCESSEPVKASAAAVLGNVVGGIAIGVVVALGAVGVVAAAVVIGVTVTVSVTLALSVTGVCEPGG